MKDYWYRRFRTGAKNGICHQEHCDMCFYNNHPQCRWKKFDAVQFANGYGKERETFMRKLLGISIGYGNPKLGAPKNEEVFILDLGVLLTN